MIFIAVLASSDLAMREHYNPSRSLSLCFDATSIHGPLAAIADDDQFPLSLHIYDFTIRLWILPRFPPLGQGVMMMILHRIGYVFKRLRTRDTLCLILSKSPLTLHLLLRREFLLCYAKIGGRRWTGAAIGLALDR